MNLHVDRMDHLPAFAERLGDSYRRSWRGARTASSIRPLPVQGSEPQGSEPNGESDFTGCSVEEEEDE